MSRTIYLELVAGSKMANDLGVGGLFVMDNALALQEQCEIVVFNDGGQLELPAKAVYLDGNGGVGLELIGFCDDTKARLAALIEAGLAAAAANPPTEEQAALADHTTPALELGDATTPALDLGDATTPSLGIGSGEQPIPRDTIADLPLSRPSDMTIQTTSAADDAQLDDDAEEDEQKKTLHERLRNLPLAEQVKRAKAGGVTERVLLERIYGKNVWEPLLRNPALTAPEVARIARMGSLPRPLLEIIFGNGGWLQIPEVRRALLSNPRLGNDQIIKLLRMMSKQELKLATTQTAYSMAVRSQAKTMLKQEGGM